MNFCPIVISSKQKLLGQVLAYKKSLNNITLSYIRTQKQIKWYYMENQIKQTEINYKRFNRKQETQVSENYIQ